MQLHARKCDLLNFMLRNFMLEKFTLQTCKSALHISKKHYSPFLFLQIIYLNIIIKKYWADLGLLCWSPDVPRASIFTCRTATIKIAYTIERKKGRTCLMDQSCCAIIPPEYMVQWHRVLYGCHKMQSNFLHSWVTVANSE